jgi:predicted Zn-dependent protease
MSESPNPAPPQQVAPLLALATTLLRTGRSGEAIAPLRDAALLQPSNAIIQHDLGLACLEVGRIPDAVAALRRAVASNPRYADAMTSIESSDRGFALTGEESYLESYHATILSAEQDEAAIRNLTKDNPKQHLQLPALEEFIAQKIRLATGADFS